MDQDLSRRTFLEGTALGAGLLLADGAPAAVAPPRPGRTPLTFDFSVGSAALAPDEVVRSACQFCNSLCGLRVAKKGGRIIEVRGEPDDPVQAGELCVKASMMMQLVYNRHRLTRPLRRVAGEKGSAESLFAPVTWA